MHTVHTKVICHCRFCDW